MPINIDEELLKELFALGDRLTEDRLYEIAVQEVKENIFDSVAQAKALEEAEGDEKKARAFYTKHRVRRIRDLISEQELLAEAERVQAEKDRLQAEEEELRKAEEREKNSRFIGWHILLIIGFFIILFVIFS